MDVDLGKVQELMKDEINKHRQRPLTLDQELSNSAQSNADWMADNNPLKHIGNYYQCIAMGTITIEATVQLWMNDRQHRNIILGDHLELGVGFNNNYWCCNFK